MKFTIIYDYLMRYRSQILRYRSKIIYDFSGWEGGNVATYLQNI